MSDLLNKASLVVIPSGYKEDTVYSVVPSDGSGDLSFTRASNGTRINSSGLVEVCPWNLLEYSEDFSNGVWSIQGSSISSDSTTAPNGTTTADTLIESNTTDEHNRFQELNIGTGEFTYSIYLKYFNTDYCALYVFNPSLGGVRYWVNVNTLTAGTSANIGSGIGTTSLSLASVGSGWVRASITFTNPSGVCRFYVANAQSNGGATTYAGNGTSGVYIWGAQVNIGSTAKPYFPTTDRLNVPRLTYQNGGGGCPSLLLEKQSTNLVTYSEQFDNAGWLKFNGAGGSAPVVTPNYALSPDGTMNADRVQLARTTQTFSYSEIKQDFGTTGTQYTVSVYLKSLSGNPTISMANDGATFNFLATLTSEWVRYTATFTASGTPSAELILYEQVTSSSLTADFLVWGFQAEASSYPTSYIPTTSSSATRVADVCTKTNIGALIGGTSGTVFFDIKTNPVLSSANYKQFCYYFTSGGAQSYMYLNSANQLSTNSNWGSFVFSATPLVANTRYKIALVYAPNDFALYVNGVSVATASSGTPNNNADITIGQLAGTEYCEFVFNQYIHFPSRLTNAELSALTTI